MMKKYFVFVLLVFPLFFVAAQEEPPGAAQSLPEEPFLRQSPSAFQNEPLLQDVPAWQGADVMLETKLPPDETVLEDLEYVEPPDPDDDIPVLREPPRQETLLQRIGRALREYFLAPGETRHLEPLRSLDWELFALEAGFSNNLIGAPDILQETIRINGAELAARAAEEGVMLNTDVKFRNALNFNGKSKGFGLFFEAQGRLDTKVPESLLSLLAHGNAENPQASGSFTVSGAVFAEAGFHHYFDINKWRINIRPSWFVPLVYVPRSDVSFLFETENNITVETVGTVTAYLPVNLNESGIAMINNFGGADFSTSVEYALFPILDIGLGLTHIPFMPARLSNKVSASIEERILDNVSIIDLIKDPGSLKLNFSPDYSLDSAEIYVTRPFNLNMWFLYRPFRTDILTVKPNVGLTTNTPAEETYINVGLEVELNVERLLFLRLHSGLEDGIWRHGVGLGINLGLIQLDVNAALASQEYLPSWNGRGLSVGAGLHLGF
jgi:hypothetical protein